MGDANGVGPEIALRAFAAGRLPPEAVVIGDLAVLDLCNRRVGAGVRLEAVAGPAPAAAGWLAVLDRGILRAEDVRVGRVSLEAGRAALDYVDAATRLALAGRLRAVVTLPINKEATRLSSPGFSGHTGYIARLCGASRYTMMLASPRLLVTHVTTHVSLREAIETLAPERIHDVIVLTAEAVRKLKRPPPIAVMALNPHAGEGGAFGDEETRVIAPAVERARREGLDVAGPLPPDTVFAKALRGRYGAVVCLYHDQGHIPMKAIGFEDTVNVTLGLLIVRTSVDHGTAFDIAWQGVANLDSLVHACRLAGELAA